MIKSIRHFHGGNKNINHLPIHCDLFGAGDGELTPNPTTGATGAREIQVAPFSQGAWSHFETDPFKILRRLMWVWAAWNSSKIPTLRDWFAD